MAFQPGAFQGDAFQGAGGTSFTIDAVLTLTTVTASFTANAVVRKTQTGSFTIDGLLSRSSSSSFTVDAFIRRTHATIAVVNSATSTTGGLGLTATAGRLVIEAMSLRNNSASWTPGTGWTTLDQYNNGFSNPPAFIFGRIAAGGETSVGGSGSAGAQASIGIELTGAIMSGATGGGGSSGTSSTFTGPSVTPTGGAACIVIGFAANRGFSINPRANTGAGWTEIGPVGPPTGESDFPRVVVAYQIIEAASGSYAPAFTNGENWGAATVVIYAGEFTLGSFTADAVILGVSASFTLDAALACSFSVNATLRQTTSSVLFVDATIVRAQAGSLTVDAVSERGLVVNAVLFAHTSSLFVLEARTAKGNVFTLDAIMTGSPILVNAVIRATLTTALDADAWLTGSVTKPFSFLASAFLGQAPVAGSFSTRALIVLGSTTGGGSAPVDAVCVEPFAGSFTVDAVTESGLRLRSFTLDADTKGQNEQRGLFTLDALVARRTSALVTVEAVIAMPGGRFPVDAYVCLAASSLTLDAFVVIATHTGSFTLDAYARPTSKSFTVDAIASDANGAFPGHQGSIVADAVVRVPSILGEPPIWIDAILRGLAATHTFTLDAYQLGGRSFTLDAFIKTAFTVNAYIRGNSIIIYPEEQSGSDGSTLAAGTFTSPSATFTQGMVGSTIIINGSSYTIITVVDEHTVTVSPTIAGGQSGLSWSIQPNPTDSEGEALVPGYRANRSFRIKITLDGVDITGDVNFAKSSFTQNAKTGPGTFELVLYGAQPYVGGETLFVEVDDFRTFGGFVMAVEAGYTFEDAVDSITTTLRGTDFNVLFDRLFVYNREEATGSGGKYTNWRSFKKGTYDDTIIRKVFGSYVDLPPGFDYTTYVDRVDIAAIEEPWTMPTAGSSLRQVMQSLSQVTTAVWWIDPYFNLHNHSRREVNAPYPITDGLGGISSRVLSVSSDISQMVNQDIVWGVLARNIDGEINAIQDVDTSSVAAYGRWQYGEFRSDLHHNSYISRRAQSILDRYQDPINRAKAVIFEPGYQAGQVAEVKSHAHGLDEALVIRSMTLTMAVIKEHVGTIYYGVPRYELQLGLDPEAPWDIYDFLPFPDSDTPYHRPGHRCEDCRTDECGPDSSCDENCEGPGCVMTDFEIYSDLPIPGLSCVVADPPSPWSCGSSLVPGETITLYSGATYHVDYEVHHNTATGTRLRARLYSPYGIGAGEREMGVGSQGTGITHASAEFTIQTGLDPKQFQVQLEGDPYYQGYNGGASISAHTYYISGPDPRFEGLPLCAPAEAPCTPTNTMLGFDTFDGRTIPSAWGNASSGPLWTQLITGSASSSVSDGVGNLTANSPGGVISQTVSSPITPTTDFTATIKWFVFNNSASCVFVFGGLNFGWRQSQTFPSIAYHDALFVGDGQGNDIAVFVGSNPTDFWNSNAGAATSTWACIKVERFGQHVRAKLWGDAHAEPGWMLEGDLEDFAFLTQDLVGLTANGAGTAEAGIDYIQFDIAECVSPDGGRCEDLEGESFGAVDAGWNCETMYVVGGVIELTGLASRNTAHIYDADTGDHLDPVTDWDDQNDGKHFTIKSGATRVIACYRNFVVNAQSTVTPRIVSPNSPRKSSKPIPIG